jgi:PAS domain-containing protein
MVAHSVYQGKYVSELVLVSLYVAGAFLAVLLAFRLNFRPAAIERSDLLDDPLVFLIRGGRVIDANFPARRILGRGGGGVEALRQFLAEHFGNADTLLDPKGTEDARLQSRDGQTQAIRQVVDDTVRLIVSFVGTPVPGQSDIHNLRAIESELAALRANTSAAPFLLWRQNAEGEVTWVNQAYLDAAREIGRDVSAAWPLPVIFPSLGLLSAARASESRRVAIQGREGRDDAWYDCHVASVGTDVLCTAIPADEAVRAENRRREFTQTLTKTFAELAIGLAIFDRSRRLVLFNPALLDLTGLPTDFLTSRPSLVAFLDRLRENRVMPEPRDYRSWRASMAELEAAAADGTYSETWSLPDGQTYHVTGRPHPDGAVALLFEDISAEMSLTRHFRTELEQSQAVLDALDDAVAVFSTAGEITISNAAYRDLWHLDPDHEGFLIADLTEATRRWHELSAPTPVWGDFREFVRADIDREEWSATVALRDGRRLSCRFAPQRGGATMAIFRIAGTKSSGQLQKAV